MTRRSVRRKIKDLILQIEPFDDLEREHLYDAIDWIDSGVEIFRIAKPANPSKHLVIYFVLHDSDAGKILLFDHNTSGLMLPSGGHSDKDVMPYQTVQRELLEELNIYANDSLYGSPPFFITQVDTVGKYEPHRDVDLWYLYEYDSTIPLDETTKEFQREYSGYRWLTYDEILSTDIALLDEHMHRFVKKLHKKSTS